MWSIPVMVKLKHFILLMLKTVVLLNIFVETGMHIFFRILWWLGSSNEAIFKQHLYEIEMFCNIINGFTVIYGQINLSLKSPVWFSFKKAKRTETAKQKVTV